MRNLTQVSALPVCEDEDAALRACSNSWRPERTLVGTGRPRVSCSRASLIVFLICIANVDIVAIPSLVCLTLADHWIYSSGMKRRKVKEARKGESLRLRLTAGQKEAFTKAAERAGLDLSSWLRSIAVREAATHPDRD